MGDFHGAILAVVASFDDARQSALKEFLLFGAEDQRNPSIQTHARGLL
jgi:hypothetical protein